MGEHSLLNKERPPVFCPGCAHERVLKTLDGVLVSMGLAGHEIAMVSDIGCSGLFDTFFNTHALHGVHGRVLTYAAGLKLCRPALTVVATMGDGGLGIGGAHLLAACRRNINLTLLVLNNFNFGMTGGQCSATSPSDAVLSSGFLNRVERPLDLYKVAVAAGAPFVARCSTYQADLPAVIEAAIRYNGFAIVEIQGICPGRYTKRNKITPEMINANVQAFGAVNGEVSENAREEYGSAYRSQCAALKPVPRPRNIEARFAPPARKEQAVTILGAAGQGIVTAGEVLALACLSGGLHVTQKNDYNITVLRGPSVTDIHISPDPIDYTGMTQPEIMVALAPEGVERRRAMLAAATPDTLVLAAAGVALPDTKARVVTVDFKNAGIKRQDWALASLAWLARQNTLINPEMLGAGLAERFKPSVLSSVKTMMEKVAK
jgi:pyruvate/2-oxoacid:ferredoxin oxidoreductase beta subunit/Pyruvate/2-oxoacid:ferredoxin oxidoreductase gamma subunit